MSRRSGRVETVEFIGFTRRVLKAFRARAAAQEMDPADLADLAAVARDLDAIITDAARTLYTQGYSWGEIGRELGVTRQAARKRFGDNLRLSPDQEAI